MLMCFQSQLSGSCIADVRITLNANGEANLNPSMFMNGNASNYTIEVQDSPLSDKTAIDCSFRNRSVTVLVTNSIDGSTCWSTLHVDDKQEFDVDIRDTLVPCILPLDSIDITSLVDISDNCFVLNDFSISYIDVIDSIYNTSSDTLRSITRIWSFTDPDGLNKVYTSNIYTERLNPLNLIFPGDTTIYFPLDPTDITNTGQPSYLNFDLFDMCNVMVIDELVGPIVQDCDKNLKYYRERMIIENITWDVIAIDTQTILYRDTTLEVISPPSLSFKNGTNCNVILAIQDFDITNNGIGIVPEAYKSILVNGELSIPGDSIEFMVGDTVVIEYGARDDCFNQLKSVSDTLIALATDSIIIECPTAIQEIAVSLDDLSERSIWVDRLFSGSISSCSPYQLVGARLSETCSPADIVFDKSISFCQADVGNSVMIRVTAMDTSGTKRSSDTCMIIVHIQDKNPPNVSCLIQSDTLYIDPIDSLAVLSDPLKYVSALDDGGLLSITG